MIIVRVSRIKTTKEADILNETQKGHHWNYSNTLNKIPIFTIENFL